MAQLLSRGHWCLLHDVSVPIGCHTVISFMLLPENFHSTACLGPDGLPLRPSVEWRPKFRQEIERGCWRGKGDCTTFCFRQSPVITNWDWMGETLITKIRHTSRRVIFCFQESLVSKWDKPETAVLNYTERSHWNTVISTSAYQSTADRAEFHWVTNSIFLTELERSFMTIFTKSLHLVLTTIRDLSPLANYTDRATAACRWS
jgi:hypothetical protein